MTKANNIRLDTFMDCLGIIEEGLELERLNKIMPALQQMADMYQLALYELEALANAEN